MFDVDGNCKPIGIKVDGDKFEVREITEAVLAKLDEIAAGEDTIVKKLRKQLCYLLKIDGNRAKNIPYRKIRMAIEYIMDEISGVNAVKNFKAGDSTKE